MANEISVLHVDDEPDFAAMAAQFLMRENDRCSVEIAHDAEEALDVIRQQSFDCIVSDYDMPGRNGIELLQAVREREPDLPFILYTGKGSEEVASEAISNGVTDYLQKGSGTSQYEVLAHRINNAVEQNRSRRAVEETEQKLTQVADRTDDILFMFDGDWSELLFINSAYEEVWNESIDDLEANPRSFLDNVHPEDQELVEQTLERILAGNPTAVEHRLKDEEGVRWIYSQANPIFDDDGDVTRIVGFVREITEQKRYERKITGLHEVAGDLAAADSAEAVCEQAVEASQELLDFDLSGIYLVEHGDLFKNPASTRTFREGAPTMPIGEGIAGKTYRTGQSYLIRDAEDHDEARPQGPYRSAISIPLGEHGVFQAIDEQPGAFDAEDLEIAELLVMHTAQSLDRLKREQALQRQNERLEKFASVLSHDIRNPLNVAQGRLELAQEACDSDDLDAVSSAHERMETLLDDLMSLARKGVAAGPREPVHLAEISQRCWEHVETAHATLQTESDQVILADESRLAELFENLFRNAVEHGGKDVTLTVGGVDNGFFVADDGPGIPEEERGAVMEPGYSQNEGGTGFGLTIVRDIAEAHGWEIQITEADEGGARFEFGRVETA